MLCTRNHAIRLLREIDRLLFCFCGAVLLPVVLASPVSASVLIQHDYDALSDVVVPQRLGSGQVLGQSFTAPPGTQSISGFRLKVRRVGHPPDLTFRVGSAWGAGDIAQGRIRGAEVNPYFEYFYGADFPARPLQAGRQYFIQVSMPAGPSINGYYELYATVANREHETAVNIDYGASTPAYAGGEALDGSGSPVAATDFAFQILSDHADAATKPPREETFAFVREIIQGPHDAVVRRSHATIRPAMAPEFVLDDSWVIVMPPQSGPVLEYATEDFCRFLEAEMGVRLKLERRSGAAPNRSHAIMLGSPREYPQLSSGLKTSESFSIDMSTEHVFVSGSDERGLMRALYYLEDEMKFREAPVLKPGRIERRPRFTPRITCAPFYAALELESPDDPYTDGLLSRISHAGYNALFVWGKIHDLGQSTVFPELGQGGVAKLKRLNAIVERAGKHGLDVYLYLTKDALPTAFFDKHPKVRGQRGSNIAFYGGAGYLMCTSVAESQRYVSESVQSIYRHAPGLRGMIIIVSGEGFIHDRYYVLNTCPRCANRERADVIADLVRTINNAAKSVKPSAELAVWTYTWPQGDSSRASLISKLPPDVIWLKDFDKEGTIERDNVRDEAYDYSISVVGPAESFSAQVPLVEKRGMRLWAKTESMISEEWIQTPYIPVYQRWIERYQKMAAVPSVRGLFMNWNHYGFMPSRVSELVKWYTWEPAPDANDLLTRIAVRDFGERAAPQFVEAWRILSQAISYYPLSEGTSRRGPMPKGPAHPLFWDPEYLPKHKDSRQFYNNLDWTKPWDIDITRKYFRLMEREWSHGVDLMRAAAEQTPESKKAEALREVGIADTLLACTRTVLYLIDFYTLRYELRETSDPAKVRQTVDSMVRLIQAEKTNSERALRWVEADSRLGYANGGWGIVNGGLRAGIYTAGAIEKKIAQLDRLLKRDIPEYRNASAKTGE